MILLLKISMAWSSLYPARVPLHSYRLKKQETDIKSFKHYTLKHRNDGKSSWAATFLHDGIKVFFRLPL